MSGNRSDPDNPQPVTREAAVRAGLQTILGQAAKLSLLLINLTLLGRLLSPRDFGLVALAFSLVGVAEVLRDFGLSASAIQARTLSSQESTNLFWLNSGIGLALGIIAGACAWPLSQLLSQPDLANVIWGLSIVFFLNGIGTQYLALLAREFRFGIIAATDILSQSVGLTVAVSMAVSGFGYWSLVGMQVSAAASLLFLRVAVSAWRPTRPHRGASVRAHLKFGAHLSGAQVIGVAASSAPIIALGAIQSTFAVGLYSRSAQLVNVPISQVFAPMTNVALATLAKTEGDAQYASAARKLALLVTTAGIAFFSLLAGTAPVLVPLFLGAQWAGAVPVVMLLSLGSAFVAMTYPYFWVFVSLGRSRSLFRYNVVTKGLLATSTVTGTLWGVQGAAAGYALGLAASWPVCVLWLRREPNLDHSGHVIQSIRVLGAGAVGSMCALFILGLSEARPASTSLAFAILTWLAASQLTWLLLGGRGDLATLATLLKKGQRTTLRS